MINDLKSAIELLKTVGIELDSSLYDGLIVKKLTASNTLDEGRTSNQTHIAITGAQMDMFPVLAAPGYFDADYHEKDESLKKYFVLSVPVWISKENVLNINHEKVSEFSFADRENVKSWFCIFRSRRTEQADQIQISLITKDDNQFVTFRKMLHEGDYFVLLKRKESFEYEVLGVKAEKGATLGEINNKFYKSESNTIVKAENFSVELKKEVGLLKDYSVETLGQILGDMLESAEEKRKMATIYVFGLKYGWIIAKEKYSANEIVKASGANSSFSVELNKALNTYDLIKKGNQGIVIINDEMFSSKDPRITGGENILLYGVPGAGKSYVIKEKYCEDENYLERVVFHPDYTYADFIGQILPALNDEGKLEYKFTPGPFTKILKKAWNDPGHMYYLIVEELNRGNAPAIFGEVFQLLDRKKVGEHSMDEIGESEYSIYNSDIAKEVFNDADCKVRIPSNLCILSTMNTSDQNVFTLDTAFQRRWNTVHIRNDVLNSKISKEKIKGTAIDWGTFADFVNRKVLQSNEDIAGSEDKRLGAYFISKDELEPTKFSEKVLKYLWDDAFKMDHDAIFKDELNSLDYLIEAYQESETDKLKAVLRQGFYSEMLKAMQEQTDEGNSDNIVFNEDEKEDE